MVILAPENTAANILRIAETAGLLLFTRRTLRKALNLFLDPLPLARIRPKMSIGIIGIVRWMTLMRNLLFGGSTTIRRNANVMHHPIRRTNGHILQGLLKAKRIKQCTNGKEITAKLSATRLLQIGISLDIINLGIRTLNILRSRLNLRKSSKVDGRGRTASGNGRTANCAFCRRRNWGHRRAGIAKITTHIGILRGKNRIQACSAQTINSPFGGVSCILLGEFIILIILETIKILLPPLVIGLILCLRPKVVLLLVL